MKLSSWVHSLQLKDMGAYCWFSSIGAMCKITSCEAQLPLGCSNASFLTDFLHPKRANEKVVGVVRPSHKLDLLFKWRSERKSELTLFSLVGGLTAWMKYP